MTVEPGWYRDPAEPTTQRYWDGEGWIGEPLPADANPPPGPPAVTEPPAESPASAPPVAATSGGGNAAPVSGPGGRPGPGAPGGWGPPGPGGPAGPTGWGSAGGPMSPPPAGTVPPGVPGGAAPPGWPPGYAYPMPEPRPHGLPLAGLGRRLTARLIDVGILVVLNALVNGWFIYRYAQEVAPVYREMMRRSLAGNSSTEGLPQAGEQAAGLQLVILLIVVALGFAYEVPAIAANGQTLGKRLMGIKVVSLGPDEPLGFGRAIRRWNTLGGVPVFLWFCCIGFVLQLVDCVYPLFDRPLRQALHDKLAQTVVVGVPRHATHPSASEPENTDTPGGPA
ncbi:RDD family protein [Plantactinospora sp. GCM10030261]|uniref:RDD family protein n=1 Tax=Plantactinospora sp. GCM10030261 TaxID=3273420 RepID=UPI003606238C